MAIVNRINELTSAYKGVKIPVEVSLDTDTKEFSVKVGMLSTYALVTQVLGVPKGSATPKTAPAGNLSFDQLVEVARRKRGGLLAASLKAAVKEVLGSCISMGVTVDGRPGVEVNALIDAGDYDAALSEAS